jgi:hypothetical protein
MVILLEQYPRALFLAEFPRARTICKLRGLLATIWPMPNRRTSPKAAGHSEANDVEKAEGGCGEGIAAKRGDNNRSSIIKYTEEILPGRIGEKFHTFDEGHNPIPDQHNDAIAQMLQVSLIKQTAMVQESKSKSVDHFQPSILDKWSRRADFGRVETIASGKDRRGYPSGWSHLQLRQIGPN